MPTPSSKRIITFVPLEAYRDRYRVEPQPVAWGGMANVWLAHDEDLGRDVAIKSLREELLGDDEARSRFARETRIIARLNHPGICPIYDKHLFENPPCYTMKYVRGTTLATAIRQSAVEIENGAKTLAMVMHRLVRVLIGVCDTIAFAHSKGVLHRDLKPHNVLLGKYGEVYVMDWGLAKVTGQVMDPDQTYSPALERDGLKTTVGKALGTPQYSSPEQAEGRVDEVDERTDVYSIGAMLHELLTDLPPYESDPTETTTPAERALRGSFKLIAFKAMSVDPADRHDHVVSLRNALEAAIEEPAPTPRVGVKLLIVAAGAALAGALGMWLASGMAR